MSYNVRPLASGESSLIRKLAALCPPLDLHTPYTYWVITEYFGDSCFILECDVEPVGFITAVGRGEDLLLWQVGILPEHRGQGHSLLLYDAVSAWARENGVRKVQVTIADDNQASRSSMESFCRSHHVESVAVGLAEISDLIDPLFSEVETRYEIHL